MTLDQRVEFLQIGPLEAAADGPGELGWQRVPAAAALGRQPRPPALSGQRLLDTDRFAIERGDAIAQRPQCFDVDDDLGSGRQRHGGSATMRTRDRRWPVAGLTRARYCC